MDPPGVLQPEAPGHGRVSRAAPEAFPALSRRTRPPVGQSHGPSGADVGDPPTLMGIGVAFRGSGPVISPYRGDR